MANKWLSRLIPSRSKYAPRSWIREVVTGSLYRISDMRGVTSFADIKTQIDTMRALARDSQISTALSYYATDATTTNSSGDIIWATPVNDKYKDVAEVVNQLFKRWNINAYARDHILELATVGNLYIPTTILYSDFSSAVSQKGVALDNNTIPDKEFDIIPSYKIPPESIVHLWYRGQPQGYIVDPDETQYSQQVLCPEQACIHFALGGLLGDYKIDARDKDGNEYEYDIQFATPMMASAVQPTQTLSLLEDALVLSSLTRTIKFIHVRCGTEEDEIRASLQEIKDAIEQQFSLNTNTGDAQSFVNPQSPNNLIYLPYVNDQEALTITDLNMAEASDADNKLLDYYQDKKLSVLGVPKEAMNFSSNEGLGNAGSVLSQRSALYANSLQRLETAYMQGWKDGLNKYFTARNMTGFVDKFDLHMNPIVTPLSTLQSEKRDSAIGQANSFIEMLKSLGIDDKSPFLDGLIEILQEEFPKIGSDVATWKINLEKDGGEGAF